MSKKKLDALCDQSDIEAYFQQELEEAQELLLKWDGSFAELYEFDRGLFRITLRLKHPNQEGCLYITCDTPEKYAGPFEWVNSNTRLSHENSLFIVRDETADFSLEAQIVDVAVKI